MIVNFFNRTKPINLIFLSFLLFIFYVIAIVDSGIDSFSMLFFFNKTVSLVLVWSCFMIFNFIISKNNLTKESDLGILFYVLLFGLFNATFTANNYVLTHLFLLLSFRRIYSLRTDLEPKQKLFDSGFWIGIATIFYPLSILFMLLNIIVIFVYNKVDWKHFLIPFLGFLTPLFLVYTYFFYYDNTAYFIQLMHLPISYHLNLYPFPILLSILFVGILGVWSILAISSKYAQESMNFKLSWILTIFQLLIAIVILMLSPNKNGKEWIFIFFPLSLIIANNIQQIKRNWLKETIVFLFIGLIIGVHFL